MKHFILALLILVTLPPLHASIDCDNGVPVGGHIGIPTEYTPPGYDTYANPPVHGLNRVQIAWLPHDEEMRYRYQEVIDIDWHDQTITQVDLYDGSLPGIVENDIREAELLSSSNFSTGHLDMLFCMPDIDSFRGLIFAHYGAKGTIVKTHAVPFAWNWIDNGLWFSAVVNESVSDMIVDTFNNVTVNNVTDDVERTTGVLPPRYLAESLVQQNLSSMTDLVFRDQALLFGGHNTLVIGNQIIITGDNASVAAVHSVNNVYSNELPIMDNDYLLTGLESHIGPISIEAHGARRTAIIVDGRADFNATVSGCVNGLRQVSVQMNHVSELDGHITLAWSDADLHTTMVSDHHSISAKLPCDALFSIESLRALVDQGGQYKNSLEVDQDRARFNPTHSRPYRTSLNYLVRDLIPVIMGPGQVDFELIKKIWGVDDLDALNGSTVYTCTQPGDETVDSIDEIAVNAFARLTPEELLSLGMVVSPGYKTHPRFDDSDGDGSICNDGELLIDDKFDHVPVIFLEVWRLLKSTQE